MNFKIKNHSPIIWIVSIAIPLVVSLLFRVKIEGVDLSFLPKTYAFINGLTAITLFISVFSIKKGNRKKHELFIKISLLLSIIFLLLYVAYHATSSPTNYGGEGVLKYIYYFILITHIILSVVVIPFVLFAYSFAKQNKFESHKKIAKIAFPLWMYVAVSGVIVYFLIAPYYPI